MNHRRVSRTTLRARSLILAALAASICLGGPATRAQERPGNDSTTNEAASEFDALKACRSVTDDGERLACYDQALTQVVAAEESGDLQVVDREEVKQTRRRLFGFSLPDIGLFGGNESADDDELFETTIVSARRTGRKQWRFTTAEGAVWQISNAPSRLRSIEPGQTAVFKAASLGTFFIRINGQMGIKGRRIG